MFYILNTETFSESELSMVTEAEKKIFIADRKDKVKIHSAFGRVLLGYLLKCGYGIDSFSYRYGENGKPYLKNSDVYFSVSHSGKYVLCCLSQEEIGCDAETVKAYNPRVAERFFTEKEYQLLEKCDCKELIFTKLWTLKESVLKKEGTGITGGLDRFCFADYVGKEAFSAYGYSFLCADYEDCVMSVCCENITCPIQRVEKDDILGYIKNII